MGGGVTLGKSDMYANLVAKGVSDVGNSREEVVVDRRAGRKGSGPWAIPKDGDVVIVVVVVVNEGFVAGGGVGVVIIIFTSVRGGSKLGEA